MFAIIFHNIHRRTRVNISLVKQKEKPIFPFGLMREMRLKEGLGKNWRKLTHTDALLWVLKHTGDFHVIATYKLLSPVQEIR